jgi:mono/diheme cytochrome c family protein
MRTVGFVALTLVSLISSAGIASAQTVDRPAPAVAEFRNSCAACHGAEGKGDGPMAVLLTVKPPDLTVLAEKNQGNFPFSQVMRIIDGRAAVGAHGPREMPIWGDGTCWIFPPLTCKNPTALTRRSRSSARVSWN